MQINETFEPGGLRVCNWAVGNSPAEVRSLQEKDPDLCPIIKWLECNTEPKQAELRLQSPGSRTLWLSRKNLQFIDRVLHYKWDGKANRSLCLVVPQGLQRTVLHGCHDLKSSGHLGQQKTLERLKQNYMWYNMSRDCIDYVTSCRTCNQNKKPNVMPKASLGQFHAGFPLERVHFHILGPFHTSEDGNNYVLMMIDQFSKWIEMAALPDQCALSVAQKSLVHFVVTFGCPLEVHTDQGKNFDSNLFKSLCKVLQIAKTRTTLYHPSSN